MKTSKIDIRLEAIKIASKHLSPNADERALFAKANQILHFILNNKVENDQPTKT